MSLSEAGNSWIGYLKKIRKPRGDLHKVVNNKNRGKLYSCPDLTYYCLRPNLGTLNYSMIEQYQMNSSCF